MRTLYSKRMEWPQDGPTFQEERDYEVPGDFMGTPTGKVTVDWFTPTMQVDHKYLDVQAPPWFEFDGEILKISVSNGRATYRKIDDDPDAKVTLFELVEES